MRTNGAIKTGAVIAFLAAMPAHSLNIDDPSVPDALVFGPFEIQTRLDAGLVVAVGDAPDLLADLDAGFVAEAINDDGLRWGASFGLHVQRDVAREGFANRAGPQGPVNPNAPQLRSLATGRYLNAASQTMRGGVAVEEASVFLRNGWGVLRLGITPGAAMAEPPLLPTAAFLVRADGGLLDPTGLAATRTDNVISGYSPKIVLSSTRILGVRASASFTPDAQMCGVDICIHDRDSARNIASAHLSDVIELALSFDHTFSQFGQVEAGLSWASGQPDNPLYTQDYEALGARVRWTRGPVSIGLSTLSADGTGPGGDYVATALAARYDYEDWSFGLETAWSEDSFLQLDSQTSQAVISRLFGDYYSVAVGVARTESDITNIGPAVNGDSATSAFIELTGRY